MGYKIPYYNKVYNYYIILTMGYKIPYYNKVYNYYIILY